MPHRASIFQNWSYYTNIYIDQISWSYTGSIQLIQHIYPFSSFFTMLSTCMFHVKSSDSITPWSDHMLVFCV